MKHFPGADNPDVVKLKNAFLLKVTFRTCLAYTTFSLAMVLSNAHQLGSSDSEAPDILSIIFPTSYCLLIIILFLTYEFPGFGVTILPVVLLQ